MPGAHRLAQSRLGRQPSDEPGVRGSAGRGAGLGGGDLLEARRGAMSTQPEGGRRSWRLAPGADEGRRDLGQWGEGRCGGGEKVVGLTSTMVSWRGAGDASRWRGGAQNADGQEVGRTEAQAAVDRDRAGARWRVWTDGRKLIGALWPSKVGRDVRSRVEPIF